MKLNSEAFFWVPGLQNSIQLVFAQCSLDFNSKFPTREMRFSSSEEFYCDRIPSKQR